MNIADTVRALLDYDPETGVFRWRKSSRNTKPGQVAGYCAGGYRQIGVNGTVYFAHRLAFLYMTGEWPAHDVDHRNGDRSDNSWANLRSASRSENNQNLGSRSDNRCGAKGVWANVYGSFSAQIQIRGTRHWLGNHPTIEAATAAYLRAKRELHTFQPTPRVEGANS